MVPKNWVTPTGSGTTVGGGVNGVVSARDGAGHSGQSLKSLSALPSHHRVMHYGDKQQEWTNLGGSKQDDIS